MEMPRNVSVNVKDYNEICRFCLDKTIHLMPIFKNEHSTTDFDANDSSLLIDKINVCIGLNV